MGETCGLKLVYETKVEADICKLCHDQAKKQRRHDKMVRDVERWQREGNRSATIERTCDEIEEVRGQIYRIAQEHEHRLQSLGQVRIAKRPPKNAPEDCAGIMDGRGEGGRGSERGEPRGCIAR